MLVLKGRGSSVTRVVATATFLSPISTKQMRNSLLVCKISFSYKNKCVSSFSLPDLGFWLATKLAGYPISTYSFFERGWTPTPHITYRKVQGMAIPIHFSFWRMDGHLRHSLYCTGLYRMCVFSGIILYVLHFIILYYTILYHNISYYPKL